jgi:hypothetical protein
MPTSDIENVLTVFQGWREGGIKLCETFLPENFAVWSVVVFLWLVISCGTILDRTA